MQTRVDSDLVVAAVRTDADLDDMIAVRASAEPDLPPPRRENLRQNLTANPDLTYLVARRKGEPVGCGFVVNGSSPCQALFFGDGGSVAWPFTRRASSTPAGPEITLGTCACSSS